jgi:hypothetical protein
MRTESVEITSRLLWGVRIGADAWISIDEDGQDADGRTRYVVYLDTPGFEYKEQTLRSGCQGGSLANGLESFLSFLSAAADSRIPESEHSTLFPEHVTEWARMNQTEIEYAEFDGLLTLRPTHRKTT